MNGKNNFDNEVTMTRKKTDMVETDSPPESTTPDRIKPIVVIGTGTMSEDDIHELRSNGICVVESDDPDSLRFIEPPPTGYDRCEWAAIQLFRRLWSKGSFAVDKRQFAEIYVDILTNGTPLSRIPSVDHAGN